MIFDISQKSVKQVQVSLKSEKNSWYFEQPVLYMKTGVDLWQHVKAFFSE